MKIKNKYNMIMQKMFHKYIKAYYDYEYAKAFVDCLNLYDLLNCDDFYKSFYNIKFHKNTFIHFLFKDIKWVKTDAQAEAENKVFSIYDISMDKIINVINYKIDNIEKYREILNEIKK